MALLLLQAVAYPLFHYDIMFPLGSSDSGIEGQVIIRPISPLERPGTVNYRPYSAEITVLDEKGQVVTQFRSGSDGHFRLSLTPGTYILRPESTSRPYPHAAKQTVEVSRGKFTKVRIAYDSGIR